MKNKIKKNIFSDVGEFVTTIMLDHTLYTGLAGQQLANRQPAPTQRPVQPSFDPNGFNQPQQNFNQQIYNPQPQQNFNQQNYNTQPVPTRPPAPTPTSRPQLPVSYDNFGSSERLNEFSSQCGVQKLRPQTSTGLVVNGKAATKGQVSKII